MLVIVSGASGHIGDALIGRLLLETTNQVRALVRSVPAKAGLREKFPSLDVRLVDYSDPGSIAASLTDDAHLIHLVGTIRETKDHPFKVIHQDICRLIVESGIKLRKITALSIVGASIDSTNPCLRSRAEADRILDDGVYPAVIIRIPMVLGGNDYASRSLREKVRRTFVFGFRNSSREQPIFIDDVIEALFFTLEQNSIEGVIELGGPESLPRDELIKRASKLVGNNPCVVSLPMWMGSGIGFLLEKVQREPLISRSTLGVLDHDDEVENHFVLRVLGRSLTPLDEMLKKTMAADKA